MLKKLLALLIALMMAFSISAGAEGNEPVSSETEEMLTETVPETEMAPAEKEIREEAEESNSGSTEELPSEASEPVSAETEGTATAETDSTIGSVDTAAEAAIPEGTEETKPAESRTEEIPATEAEGAVPDTETQKEYAVSVTPETATVTEQTQEITPETIKTEEVSPETIPEAKTDEESWDITPDTITAVEESQEAIPESAAAEEPQGELPKTATAAEEQLAELPETADILGTAAEVQMETPIPADVPVPNDVLNAATEQADVLPMSDYANENSVQGFVYRLYRTVLQRVPDESGFMYWVNLLNSGEKTAGDVIDGFFNSNEYKTSGKSNDQIVEDCYNTMLNRRPDADGFRYWRKRLDIGMTAQSILAGFVGSEEFTRLALQYGVVRGDITLTNARDLNYERTYFVYRLYQNCLSRNPDPAGEEEWCAGLQNGLTGSDVAGGFFLSDEFNKNRYNNSAYVQILYKTILGRDYDVDGLIDWTTKLNYKDSREKVLNGFIGSPEFAGQCRTAEIIAGDPIATPDDTEEWKYNIKVLQLCNEQRRRAGLKDLYTREDLLWDVAMTRADEITERFDHTRPDGTNCFSLFKEQGFYGYLGENLAAGAAYRDPAAVVEAWMESKSHRENILNTNYTYLATGLVIDPFARSYCGEGKYVGQYVNFGIYSAQSFCTQGFKIN